MNEKYINKLINLLIMLDKNEIFEIARQTAEKLNTPDIKKVMEVIAKIEIIFIENHFTRIEKDLIVLTLSRFSNIECFKSLQ